MKYLTLVCFLFTTSLFANDDWTHLNGPYGGWIWHIEESEGNLYCSLHHGDEHQNNFFKSTDQGNTWVNISKNMFEQTGFTGIVTEFAVSGDIIIGVGSSGLVRTTDGGANWTFNKSSNSYKSIYFDDGKFYVCFDKWGSSSKRFDISDNGGETWVASDSAMHVHAKCIYKNDGRIFFGTATKGLYISDDEGATWEEKNIGIFGKEINCITKVKDYVFLGTSTAGIHISSG